MSHHPTPELSPELAKLIKLVRHDIGTLLFHFTRGLKDEQFITVHRGLSMTSYSASAGGVLHKILSDGALIGTSKWSGGEKTVCFTEAPIHEFNRIFALVEFASSEEQRPRYEPYGVAVTKEWLFEQGGRPVIYDHPDAVLECPESQRYRAVPYDPVKGIDSTWEREWRIKADSLKLDPKQTLVVVPTADEAFEIVYEHSDIETDYDENGPSGAYHVPQWLAVSLDIFGLPT